MLRRNLSVNLPNGFGARRWMSAQFKAHIPHVRNIGISAHIDSGKTTLSERILFYTGKIKAIHEVKGGTDVGATMDSMELEKERGITIRSAATYCRWKETHINLIDTPGHVDFTIEVERALRVLDGAVLLMCAVGGVQSQTLTVDRQMKRYGVPRICFINKMDRDNADPVKAMNTARHKLGINCAFLHVNIGVSQDFAGVVDVIENKAFYFDGKNGETIRVEPVPDYLKDATAATRKELVARLADADETIAEYYLEEKDPSNAMLHEAIRRATIANKFVPVMMGSAYKNKGVQLLLDAVTRYLPSPDERTNKGFLLKTEIEDGEKVQVKGAPVVLETDDEKPLVAMVFKLEETAATGLSNYIRVYQGRLRKADSLVNMRTGHTFSPGKLVRMHANSAEPIDDVKCGEICAILGEVNASSGDTLLRAGKAGGEPLVCEDFYVPPRVISMSIKGKDDTVDRAAIAQLEKFMREDPTFRVYRNGETNEILVEGMGELHLEIYLIRLEREFGIKVTSGRPTVNYREVITEPVEFDYVYKRQSGGQGQYAHVKGTIKPLPINLSSEKGVKNKIEVKCSAAECRENLQKSFCKQFEMKIFNTGKMIKAPLWGVHVHLTGGSMHEVDSTDHAYKNCATALWDEFLPKCKPTLVEPWMDIEIRCPVPNLSDVMQEFVKREGVVQDQRIDAGEGVIVGEVAAESMFGFIIDLRKATKGQGNYSMEFKEYRTMPPHKAQEKINERNAVMGRETFQLV
jgi:elongation factor G